MDSELHDLRIFPIASYCCVAIQPHFDIHRPSHKLSVNSMTKQNHKCTKKIHIIGFTPSWMWHFVFGLAAPEVSVKGSKFIFKAKAVQEKCQMWRHNSQVHRRENFKFHVHNWSPRSNEHGTRVQCPYGCAHGCRLPIRASVLLNIVLITLRNAIGLPTTEVPDFYLIGLEDFFRREKERYTLTFRDYCFGWTL